MQMNAQEAYLYGLMTGRGHIFSGDRVAIEFSHANEYVEGIAHCSKCGFLATKPKNSKHLICKNPECGSIVSEDIKKKYNQPKETLKSLSDVIIPFLKGTIAGNYEISSSKAMTLLIIDFRDNQSFSARLQEIFSPARSFDSFHIPQLIHDTDLANKTEFINGLLDTSGFANAGGWLNRDGERGHGRMRAYFQIVRNWHLPVEIDNFLRQYFDLPIQTIDWGHPNIRDGNLVEYFEGKTASWSREHQVKFFPEFYGAFKFRLSAKQSLFEELLEHNRNAVFTDKQDWFPPSKFGINKVKPSHPGEQDPRIPEEVRCHVDAFWQVNLLMGCKFLGAILAKCKYPEMYKLNGDDSTSFEETKAMFTRQSEELRIARFKRFKNIETKKSPVERKKKASEIKELDTYIPLVNFFNKHFTKKYSQNVQSFDTSAGNLNAFLKTQESSLLKTFEDCEKFRIRPDVVSFFSEDKTLAFVESKITPLDLKALGQLVGYCLVAKPVEAILVSTKVPTSNFLKILKSNRKLLEYDQGKFIQIATLDKTNNVIFIPI